MESLRFFRDGYLDSTINFRPMGLIKLLPELHKRLLLSTVEQRHECRGLFGLLWFGAF